jgi:hypothetical protein
MSYKVTFRANRAGIARVGSSNGAYRALEQRADRVISLARAAAADHFVTGDYDRGFRKERVRIGGQASVRVFNISKHGDILENGSRPHIIEPKNKKALAWPGGLHPVARVHHPGTPAYHFLRNALRAAGR